MLNFTHAYTQTNIHSQSIAMLVFRNDDPKRFSTSFVDFYGFINAIGFGNICEFNEFSVFFSGFSEIIQPIFFSNFISGQRRRFFVLSIQKYTIHFDFIPNFRNKQTNESSLVRSNAKLNKDTRAHIAQTRYYVCGKLKNTQKKCLTEDRILISLFLGGGDRHLKIAKKKHHFFARFIFLSFCFYFWYALSFSVSFTFAFH